MKFFSFATVSTLLSLSSCTSAVTAPDHKTPVEQYEKHIGQLKTAVNDLKLFERDDLKSRDSVILRKLLISPIFKNTNDKIEIPIENEDESIRASIVINFLTSTIFEKAVEDLTKANKYSSVQKVIELLGGVSRMAFSKELIEKLGNIPVLELSNVFGGLITQIGKIESRKAEADKVKKILSEIISEISSVKIEEHNGKKVISKQFIEDVKDIGEKFTNFDSASSEFFNSVNPETFKNNRELLLNAVNLSELIKSFSGLLKEGLRIMNSEPDSEEKNTIQGSELNNYSRNVIMNTVYSLIYFAVSKNSFETSLIPELRNNVSRIDESYFESFVQGVKGAFERGKKIDSDVFFFNDEKTYSKFIEVSNKKSDTVPRSVALVPSKVTEGVKTDAETTSTKSAATTDATEIPITTDAIPVKATVSDAIPAGTTDATEISITTGTAPIEITDDTSDSTSPKTDSTTPASNEKQDNTLRNIVVLLLVAFAIGICGLIYFKYNSKEVTEEVV